jgi:PhnB protein
MVSNPPQGMQRITPYLLYEDLGAAIEWVTAAFGLSERSRMSGPDGKPQHVEMTLEDGVIMMGQPQRGYESPRRHGHVCQLVYAYVEDVDAHWRQAEGRGARILTPPEDKPFGDRVYSAEDPEGHHWFFAQHLRDPST